MQVSKNQVVGHGRDHSGHVRCVLLDSQEGPGIRSPSNECQRRSELAVGSYGAVGSGQPAGEVNGHRLLCATSRARAL